MKSIKAAKNIIGTLVVGCVLACCLTSNTSAKISASASADDLNVMLRAIESVPAMSAESAPRVGTFYSVQNPNWPPLPGNPKSLPVWNLGDGTWLLDDRNEVYSAPLSSIRTANGLAVPDFGDIGNGSDFNSDPPPDISNYLKFRSNIFSVVDTNDAAANNPGLYNTILAFPDSTNTAPRLQILPFQSGFVLKASHFDYSSETARDFALVINDKLETPLYKNIDLSNPSNNIQNGWLVQGTVPHSQVTDPMYLVVTNMTKIYNAFFCAIPYGGPQIQLTGPQPNDTVSNIVTFQAIIADLSGITNEQFEVTVDGAPARYSLGASNTFNLDSKYNPNGPANIDFDTLNNARIYNPTNPPDNSQLFFSSSTNLPLDFENPTYLAFGSYYASPAIGVNYLLYVIDRPHDIDVTIADPANGEIVAHYAGYVPYAATIEVPWNFTEADGLTPYSNDTYVVTFTASSNPTTINTTNHIDRQGVREAAANILNYEQEDPSLTAGPYLNSQAQYYVDDSLAFFYLSLYWTDFGSQTQYDPTQIGFNRDDPSSPTFPLVLARGNQGSFSSQILSAIADLRYSDFTYYMGHGNDSQIYGGPPGTNWVNVYLDTATAGIQAVQPQSSGHPNWRFRKVALWSCFSDTSSGYTASSSWPKAFGIRPTGQQAWNWISKNVGLFFGGALPQGGYSGTFGNTSVEVATDFDLLWVGGPDSYPGGFDPTYSFAWALRQTREMNPELDKAYPALIGFTYLPFAGVYDSQLVTNDVSNIKN